MSALDDEGALLERARRGDREAFWELVAPSVERVHRLLVRMTGSQEEAEDLCQDSIVRAMRGIASFRGGSRFSTWFYRIALNVALSARTARHETAAPPEVLDGALPAAMPSSYAAASPSVAAEIREGQETLRAAMRGLPPRQRAVVLLRIEEELPFAEIAERMDLTVGAVKAHFWQATQRLRRDLTGQE